MVDGQFTQQTRNTVVHAIQSLVLCTHRLAVVDVTRIG
jgi:hypothetical protein